MSVTDDEFDFIDEAITDLILEPLEEVLLGIFPNLVNLRLARLFSFLSTS
ncbi:unnamed protein product [Amoebophrya sp. A25]|nr:unnamed protein product [Amoebophrya sp. A25]|eukprot:GSA25T00013022001.1